MSIDATNTQTEVPTERALELELHNVLAPGDEFCRLVYMDDLVDHMPKDPNLRVQVYTTEIAPGGSTPWHTHNGTGLFLVTRGRIIVECRDTGESREYQAGDVLWEPLGVVHRGRNPDPERRYFGIGVKFCLAGLEHDLPVEPLPE